MKRGVSMALALATWCATATAAADESGAAPAYPPLEMQSPALAVLGASSMLAGIAAGITGAIVAAEYDRPVGGGALIDAGAAGLLLGIPVFRYGSASVTPEVQAGAQYGGTRLTFDF